MDEEMEYAEMLEIPVATVNVVKKRTKRSKKTAGLKEKVISKVNENATQTETTSTAPPTPADASLPPAETATDTTNTPVDTSFLIDESAATTTSAYVAESTPIHIPRRKKTPFFARLFGKQAGAWEVEENSPTPEATAVSSEVEAEESHPTTQKAQKYSLLLGLEFAAAFALCLGIFLTNVFLPGSAINTFFRFLATSPQQADVRTYADFTLSGIISEDGAELTLSETGVLSFTDAGCVYPAVDGTVTDVLQDNDGTWTVKISHSPSFSEVISGLSYAPLQTGDFVKSNVPVGYSDGQKEVQVTMYESGALLNCFYVTEDGGLAWIVEE